VPGIEEPGIVVAGMVVTTIVVQTLWPEVTDWGTLEVIDSEVLGNVEPEPLLVRPVVVPLWIANVSKIQQVGGYCHDIDILPANIS
jgi:hypothetical protein